MGILSMMKSYLFIVRSTTLASKDFTLNRTSILSIYREPIHHEPRSRQIFEPVMESVKESEIKVGTTL